LYVIYQARSHFSPAVAAVIFAVDAAEVLAALLLAGRSSDQAGRQPVPAAALGASAMLALSILLAALCLFALASIARALAPGRAVVSQ
jgi:hypothetical protein